MYSLYLGLGPDLPMNSSSNADILFTLCIGFHIMLTLNCFKSGQLSSLKAVLIIPRTYLKKCIAQSSGVNMRFSLLSTPENYSPNS